MRSQEMLGMLLEQLDETNQALYGIGETLRENAALTRELIYNILDHTEETRHDTFSRELADLDKYMEEEIKAACSKPFSFNIEDEDFEENIQKAASKLPGKNNGVKVMRFESHEEMEAFLKKYQNGGFDVDPFQ